MTETKQPSTASTVAMYTIVQLTIGLGGAGVLDTASAVVCNSTSNVTSVTEVRSASARLFAGTWHPLVSVITPLYYVAIIFHRRMCYRALSLRYACIRSSSIILTGYLCAKIRFFRDFHCWDSPRRIFVYSVTQSVTQPVYLMPREGTAALALRRMYSNN